MLIGTFTDNYIVVSIREESEEKSVYICKKSREEDNRNYTVVKLNNMANADKFVEYFTTHINKEEFLDFIECFVFNECLYFVYLNHKAPSLGEGVLKRDHTFIERLEIGRGIINKMVYMNMPYAIQCNVLNVNKIMVDEDMTINFDYDFCEVDEIDRCTIRDVARLLLGIMNLIFRKEIELNSSDEINEFLEYLVSGKYESYIDFLYKYNEMYKAVKDKPEEELMRPRTKLYILWETAKIILKKFKVVLMVALVIGALAYLGFTIINKMKPSPVTGKAVPSIGEVPLK